MKNLIKKYNKIVLFVGVCLCSLEVFSASEVTKKLIHETLAKYGISAGGKEVCGTPLEPQYNEATGKVSCNREKFNGFKANNYWSPSDRLCKPCPIGTILNKNTFQSCNKIKCQNDMILMLPQKGECPKGFELMKITNNKCPVGYEFVDLSEKCPNGYERFNNK